MAESAVSILRRLEEAGGTYGGDAADLKVTALDALAGRRFGSADEVLRFHELLALLRAYPDDARVLERVEAMLEGYAERGDVRRFRRALRDSGIAGTAVHFRFFWSTARWLASRWPDRLRIDWAEFDDRDRLEPLLPLLTTWSESPALDEIGLDVRGWIERLKGPDETDAAFLVRRFLALDAGDDERRWLYEHVDPPLVLDPGAAPSRTVESHGRAPVVWQTRPLDRSRPNLRKAVRRSPVAVREASLREGRQVVDLARSAMVVRNRDLYSFEHGDPRDVRIIEFEDGLSFACVGAVPERRLLLESVYGFLTLKNRVPIGYVLASGLFGSSEVMYNVFETYRGGEAARIYGCALAMVHGLLGADSFSVDPYQLGHDNEEGQRSGAWWFYEKLGFRPHDREVKRLVAEEHASRRADPTYRSSRSRLQALSAAPVFFHLGRPRRDVLGHVALGRIGLRASDLLARRFGSDREEGLRTCAREAARRFGVGRGGWSAGERLAFTRWSPLLLAIDGVESWTDQVKRAAVDAVKAKGGRRESEFVRLFDAHADLRAAVLALADEDG